MKKLLFCLLFISLFCISGLFSSDLSIYGFVRSYGALSLDEELDFPVFQNTLDLKLEFSAFIGMLYANPVINYEFNETPELDLREIYIDVYLDWADFRIGRQQVIWGKSDGVFITDVVSPKNLQEFLLPEFEEIRIGVNGLKSNFYIGNSTIEFIWLPLFTPNSMPEQDSIWNPANIDFSGSDDSITFKLENSEFFGRFSLFTSFADLELMGGYMWDDEPIAMDHNRLIMGGGSFSSHLGSFVVRGEGAFYSGKRFYRESAMPVEKNYVHYAAGIDFRLSGWTLSTQFIEKIILDYEADLIADQISNTMTFLISKSLLRETLHMELFSYLEINDLNALIRPSITYDISDGMSLLAGANIFLGDEGTFGQFSHNSMVYGKLKYSF